MNEFLSNWIGSYIKQLSIIWNCLVEILPLVEMLSMNLAIESSKFIIYLLYWSKNKQNESQVKSNPKPVYHRLTIFIQMEYKLVALIIHLYIWNKSNLKLILSWIYSFIWGQLVIVLLFQEKKLFLILTFFKRLGNLIFCKQCIFSVLSLSLWLVEI